jgi:hypothetical protein
MKTPPRDKRQEAGINNRSPGTKGSEGPPTPFPRILAVFLWGAGVTAAWSLSTLIKWQESVRSGEPTDLFRLVTEQSTSAAGALAMIPFVIYWLRRFPIGAAFWIVAHLAGSVIFTLGHFGVIILLRSAVFAANGMTYHWRGGVAGNLLFEYQKDIGIYLIIIAIVTGLRYWQQRRNAPVASTPEPTLLVHSGTGERTLKLAEIDYLESARNYVSVFAEDREYLLRETMNSLSERLEDQGFARVHRRYLVRLAAIEELRGGDGRQTLRLRNGAAIPLGRSYRRGFRERYRLGLQQ